MSGRFFQFSSTSLLPQAPSTIFNDITPELEDWCIEQDLNDATTAMDSQLANASTFALSNKPFSMTSTSALSNSSHMLMSFDPEPLERDIQVTGQELSDAIRQLQADLQLAANLESKRAAEAEIALQAKLSEMTAYADERISMVNDQLDRVSRQILRAIGAFIGTLAAVFATYTISSK